MCENRNSANKFEAKSIDLGTVKLGESKEFAVTTHICGWLN